MAGESIAATLRLKATACRRRAADLRAEIERLEQHAADFERLADAEDALYGGLPARAQKPSRVPRQDFVEVVRKAGHSMRSLAAALRTDPYHLAVSQPGISMMRAGKRSASLAVRRAVFELTGWPVDEWPRVSR